MLSKCLRLFLCLILTRFGAVYAQTSAINVVSTAVPALQISPDARGGGMGDASIAATPDANSIYWNAGKTVFSTVKSQVGVTYTPWLRDVAENVYLLNAAGYYKLDEHAAVAGGVRYFNLGNAQMVDGNGNLLKTQKPYEYSIEAAYSRKIARQWAIGLTFKFINSSLATGNINGAEYKAGHAVATDVAVFYDGRDRLFNGFTGGVTLSDLGTPIGYTGNDNKKSFLPANLGVGLAYHYAFDDLDKVSIEIDGNHLMVPVYDSANGGASYYGKSVLGGMGSSFSNKAYQVASGVEYTYNDMFFLRAGYHWETKGNGGSRFFTAGVGLKYVKIQFNFSYLAQNGGGVIASPLSNTLRFSALFDIGQ